MLNNRGQSLVLFVIVLPILLFILVLVIDIGKVMVLKQELNNISEIVLDYGLDKLNNIELSNELDNNNLDNSLNDSLNNNSANDILNNSADNHNDNDSDIVNDNNANYNNDDSSDDLEKTDLDNDINYNIESNNLDVTDLESQLVEIVKLNNDDIDMINVRIENNKIYIDLEDKEEGIFSSLVNISIFKIKSSYVGYMDNNEKRIERVSG